jgi:hypothetical protein
MAITDGNDDHHMTNVTIVLLDPTMEKESRPKRVVE